MGQLSPTGRQEQGRHIAWRGLALRIVMSRIKDCDVPWVVMSEIFDINIKGSAFVQLVYADFTQLFKPNWAPDHIVTQGENILLTLDNTTGCGFESRSNYLFGKASLQIKLIQGDSAGIVTAFYMSSEGPNHDELDFEFLGNILGEPYLVQTNVYVNGSGNREQRHTLWFDPTTDFHTYSFFWNHRSIMEHSWQLRFAVFSFLQANTVDELPEKLISVICVSHVELSSAVVPVLEPGPSVAVVILLCSLHLHHVTIVFLYGSTWTVTTQISDPGSGGVTEMASEPIVTNLRNDRALGIINATIIIRRTPIEFVVFAAEEADDYETQHDEALLAADDDPVDDPMEDPKEDTEDPDEDPEEDPTTVFDFPTSHVPSIDGYSTDDDDSTEGDQIVPDVVATDDDETSEDSAR
ncbi:hypothetical protein POM88_006519 [Heracleum sosnowskyi]|uniref:GH16 domain-containing protein n=1 Tax=Heracleum sosnowskyi TaxID=360622 RepID=A0AAD8J5L7_9APIA|nr:hypothetical protein POM88_006519 [Heracleum sosnowskyi]